MFDTQKAAEQLATAVQNAEPGRLFGNIQSVLDWLLEQLMVAGICEHKEWLIQQADAAIEKVVALDALPGVLHIFEPVLDAIVERVAKAKAKALVAKVCP